MDALPYLVLENIFLEIKRANRGLLNDLLSCMLVCKTWHDTVAPLVYGAIALDNECLIAFAAGFNAHKYARHVLSVTLRLKSSIGDISRWTEHWSHADFARCLSLFVPPLATMCRLASFSFHATNRSSIASRSVVELLDCLPETCRALEIKYVATERYSGWSRSQQKGSSCEGPHVCEAVRRLLPQLVHVKLHMASICAGLFGLEPGGAASPASQSPPVAMPNLRTMMINMGREKGIVDACGQARPYGRHGRYPETWMAFTRAMERAFEDSAYRSRQGLVATVIGPLQPQIGLDLPTFTRANVLDKEAWVITQSYGPEPEPQAFPGVLRSRGSWTPTPYHEWPGRLQASSPAPPPPDGSGVIYVDPTTERLWEGEDGNWCSVMGGARLPREALLNDERGSGGSLRRLAELVGWSEGVDEECPLHTVQPRRPLYLRMSNPLPGVPIDMVAEVRLNGAVKRAPEDDYLSLEFPKKQRVEDEDETAEESETEGGGSESEDEESEPEVEESESGVEESEPVSAGGGLLSWVTSLFTRS